MPAPVLPAQKTRVQVQKDGRVMRMLFFPDTSGFTFSSEPVPPGTMYKKIADSSYQVRMPSNAGFRLKPAVGGLGLKY